MLRVAVEDLTYCRNCATVFYVDALETGYCRTSGEHYLLPQACPVCGAQLQDAYDSSVEARVRLAEHAQEEARKEKAAKKRAAAVPPPPAAPTHPGGMEDGLDHDDLRAWGMGGPGWPGPDDL